MFKNRILLTAFLFVAAMASMQAQEKQYQVYGVGFYNQENLFDTVHDYGKNDYEYLPDGGNKWNSLKYNHKLRNMSRALADLGTDVLPKNVGCAIIGLSEVENIYALNDLIAQPELRARGYRVAHIEGPDRRGVDCALLYNPALFRMKDMRLVPYKQELEKDSAFFTRGFLVVSGRMAGENVAAIVCHWPSRFSVSFYRESAGRQVRAVKDSIMAADPSCKVFVMGDMNDDPQDRSMARELQARRTIEEVEEGDMYNPWWRILEKGTGTLSYQGRWNLFDQIVMTPNLLNRGEERDFTSLKYWKAQVFRRDYLLQQEGAYKGTPKRTHASGVWLDGYSDHLPVVLYLVKEKSAIPVEEEELELPVDTTVIDTIHIDLPPTPEQLDTLRHQMMRHDSLMAPGMHGVQGYPVAPDSPVIPESPAAPATPVAPGLPKSPALQPERMR